MKKIIPLLVLCVAIVCNAYGYENQRTVTKTFPASSKTKLAIEHKYGEINIKEWDKNEIDFNITITAQNGNQSRVDDFINSVNIKFANNDNVVQAITEYNFPNNGNNNINNFKVTYNVKVPKGISYQLNNKYGNIIMENASGKADIIVKYGNFTANNLTNGNNYIDCKYGSTTINSTDNLDLILGYGKVNINEANTLKMDSKYSSGNIGKVGVLQLNSKYEKYRIAEAGEVKADLGYTTIDIDKLNKSFQTTIQAKYGKINISGVNARFEDITIDAKYTNIAISTDKDASFNVEASSRYANIKIRKDNLQTQKDIKESNSSYIQGTVGSNPKASIKVTSSYGGITID